MSQVSGRVTIALDNDALHSKPGATLDIGGEEREFDATDQGKSYFKEKSLPAKVECTVPHLSDVDVVKLRRWKNGTLTFTTDAGHVYTVSDAATARVNEIGNGEFKIGFGGDAVEE